MTFQDWAGETVAVVIGSSPHVIAAMEHFVSSFVHWVYVHLMVAAVAIARGILRK